MKKILVIDAHPTHDSFCTGLAGAFEGGAMNAGASVQTLRLRDLSFDPIRHTNYNINQEWEPDLQMAWQAIEEADHLCFVYPTWWGGHPALLQGFIERVFLPGLAFKYHKDDPYWDKLLKGKTADVLTTMDTPHWVYRLIYRSGGILRIKKTILEFVGIKSRVTVFDQVRYSDDKKRQGWLVKAQKLGRVSAR